MSLAHCAHRHDKAFLPPCDAGLVGVRDDAGVHQCSSGVAIFMAKIGTDKQFARHRNAGKVELYDMAQFNTALVENRFGLPVALLEIDHHPAEIFLDLKFVKLKHIVDEPLRTRRLGAVTLPAEMERAKDDQARIGAQLQIVNVQQRFRCHAHFVHR
jgi:hypothetical protein